MHGSSGERRALEREALRNVINQWNANRLDLFELSEPNEDLEFHGVMRFYFQDSGQKVATKCIRVASDATVEDVIGTLVEKFRPDMRMLSVPSYALYELHENCPERKMGPDEKPLLVQLNWHVDDREGRFLLKNVDDKTASCVGLSDSNASFRRKLSKREKKQLKKQEKSLRLKNENGDINDKDGVAEKLYTELPETIFTRSISNPEAVMRRRRQQKLEKKLQQFRSKDGGPDTGGTLKIYGEALCRDVPYKTLLLSVRDCASAVVREMLDKYGLNRVDPSQWCLVQVTTNQTGGLDTEYVLDDDECPLSILMNAPNTSSIMFHVRRRPADCAPRKRKKKPGAIGTNQNNSREARCEAAPLLVELGPDGSAPTPGDTARTIRLVGDVMEVGSANGIALQLYGPHIQPRHCVITNTDGIVSLMPCHADAHCYVNGQRVHQTTILTHGSLVKFGHSNTYRFLDPAQEDRSRYPTHVDGSRGMYDRSPRALSPAETSRENFETTFDLEGNVETVSTASGTRDDSRSLGSASENRLSGIERYPRGQDPILPAVLEFPEEPQEQFLARVITHLDVTTPTFRLAPAYTLYLCARYRASTHYRPELTPTERAHKLTVLLQHAAMLIRHTVQDRSTESTSQAFWLANASELLHFLKSDRHVSAFSLQAQDTLADSVQLAFRNLVACLTDELNAVMSNLMSELADDHPREIISVLSGAMNLLRKCRANAALTIQLFSQLFHWISSRSLSAVINNPNLCTRHFGVRLFNRLRNLQSWAESQGLELAAECHLAKIVQCAHLLQAQKYTAEELANLSAACFKLNSLQLRALLTQYKPEPGEQVAPPPLLDQAARAAEGVADELARAEGREVRLHDDPAPPLQLLLPDDGFSCDVVQGVPPGLADFLHPLQASGLCRLAAQPTSSGHWTVYMSVPRPPSALSTTQPEVQVIRLHKAGGGMGLSIVAAKGAGQERLGIYIKSVVPGGAADRDGRLGAGDQLLSVDGQSLLGITQEKAAEFLVRTGSTVTLEVAKGGAVYHGLATLLQQPSPTPHRAQDSPGRFTPRGSQESLNSEASYCLYTPPAASTNKNIFFNSDDSLYKSELRKLRVPRIEIRHREPVFNLQVTDFSEPQPKDIIVVDDSREKFGAHAPRRSFSLDVQGCEPKSRGTNFLNAGGSLQELSSSTSSINSGVHESNLDLSSMDPDTPVKHRSWKSPDEMRHVVRRFEELFVGKSDISAAASAPDLSCESEIVETIPKYFSQEGLNDRLSEYERLEVLKLLHDWSLQGSESKSVLVLRKTKRTNFKFISEPNLSPESKCRLQSTDKFKSDGNLSYEKYEEDFLHKCKYRNCIFNSEFTPKGTTNINYTDRKSVPKGILKNSNERVESGMNFRRNSEVIDGVSFNKRLVRCDSLERLTQIHKRNRVNNNHLPSIQKKFPEAYIITKRNSVVQRKSNYENNKENKAKIVVFHKKCWKSCSDIKYGTKTVRKCCKNARKSCPVYNKSGDIPRKMKSLTSVEQDDSEKMAVTENPTRPRRMSERDLPSRVDAERTIPSSKSVPALHHISAAPEQHRTGAHDTYNPGYSRTSSNNSINLNSSPMVGPPNGNPAASQSASLRSRSTHNLHQQDAGFYQNLSVYRNKMPSPQHLGDRTSVLRSSQNSLQSSGMNAPRPSSAYYPQTSAPNAARSNLHQSIPNLKTVPSAQRGVHNEESRAGSFPSVNQYNQNNYGGNYNPNLVYPGQAHPRSSSQEAYAVKSPNEMMRVSKSEDLLRQYAAATGQTDSRYASSNNVLQLRQAEERNALMMAEENKNVRSQGKLVEMGEEVRRRQNRVLSPPYQQPPQQFHPSYHQYYNQQQPSSSYSNTFHPSAHLLQNNTQSMQNLTLNHPVYQQHQQQQQLQYPKSPPVAPKPSRKQQQEEAPEPPPSVTHPLYSASAQEPPKVAFYQTGAAGKSARDPWAREEQERQAELRREHARQWQEQQIRELVALGHVRTQQQEEQLRVLQLEREFQRRALEAAEQDDDDTEKDSASPIGQDQTPVTSPSNGPPPVPTSQPPLNMPPKLQETPTSILKPGGPSATNNQTPQSESIAPPPPERGSSYTVMSLRNKETTKRVSFNDVGGGNVTPTVPSSLQLEDNVREDPNSFIRQAESMLASPTTPTDSMSGGMLTATPGVIGAQEVYRDPRTRRLAEQAQLKSQMPVPEKLSFKEKMKMFAMETGEQGTPKDKSKISRAQREIDNLGSPPNPSLVH